MIHLITFRICTLIIRVCGVLVGVFCFGLVFSTLILLKLSVG